MKIMKIKFIIPSWHYYADPLKHQPFWELYYATQLREQGFDVSISDMRKTVQKDIISLANEIEESDFYFYWIFKSGDAAEIYSIAKFLKKKFPNSTHAAGGTHVDMCQEESQNYFDSFVVDDFYKMNFKNIFHYKNFNLKEFYQNWKQEIS